MHLPLKRSHSSGWRGANVLQQQAKSDTFMKEFNEE